MPSSLCRQSRPSASGSSARGARPWACPWSPRNRARTPSRRAQVSAAASSACLEAQFARRGQREGRRPAARHEDVLEERELTQDRLHHREQRRRNEQRLGATVAEDVGVLSAVSSVLRHYRHHARPDRTPERNREVDRIEQEEEPRALARYAVGIERLPYGWRVPAVRLGQRLAGIDENRLWRAAPGRCCGPPCPSAAL